MDIGAVAPTERTIEITHPATGEEIGLSITLISLDDKRMSKLKNRIQDEARRLEARGKHFKTEQIADNSKELAFASIIEWNWKPECEFTLDGEKNPEMNKVNVMKLFDKANWVLSQINDALNDGKSFFTK